MFRREKRKRKYIAWKVDLSKAYDRIEWRYLQDMIWETGLRGRFYELVKQYFTTV